MGHMESYRLRNFCEAQGELEVFDEPGGEWSVRFRGQPGNFADVCSPTDPYPEEMWAAAGAYFGSWDMATAPLSGGRYAVGLNLQSRELAFLRGRSLGQICHIVQLAISQRKILAYQGSDVIPYASSELSCKERAAETSSASAVQGTVACWEVVRACLRDLLMVEDRIPLANLKQVFHARFQMQLSETALGHAKLSELLRNERLRDVCHLRLDDVGYVLAAGRHPHCAKTAEQGSGVTGRHSAADCVLKTEALSLPELEADDEEEDYDAAADLLYRGGLHESLCGSECPWGATPEHSFNEADRQASAVLAQSLAALRLSPLVEATKLEDCSTDGGESLEDSL
jgi:hypothetical protein